MSKLKELEKRLKTEPQNFGLRVQVAGLMREAGRSTEAVELYRSVALAYRDQGRTNQAIAVCRSILEIAPDDVACNALLSTLTTGSKPSIPSLTPPPPAGPRSATQPNVGRAPTRPSASLLSRPTSTPSQPPPNRATSPAPARSRLAQEPDVVAPAPSRPATPSQSPILTRPATPSQPPPNQVVRNRPGPPSQPPPNQIVRNRPVSPTEPPDVSPVPARPPFASGSEPRGRAPRTASQPHRTGSQPPRTGSSPPGRPAVVMIPPKSPSQPPRAFTDVGTPGPAPSRAPTEPAGPTAVTGRLPLEPPTRASPTQPPPTDPGRWSSRDSISQGIPKRRSSLEATPLPQPLPHHLHDPTARNRKVDPEEMQTNPQVQRKLKGATNEDVARELDTRPHRRIKSDELEKISHPPPTVEVTRIPDEEVENTKTQESPPHKGSEDDLTMPRDLLDLDPDTEQ